MENNNWIATFALVSVVAIVGIAAVFGMSGITGNAMQKIDVDKGQNACEKCISSCPQGNSGQVCIEMCRIIPGCENAGQPCGPVNCAPGTFCCNPLHGICVDSPKDYCIM